MTRMSFSSTDEAFQFLADQISALSERVTDLENAKMAQRGVLTWLITVLQYQDGKTQQVLSTMAEKWASNLSQDDSEVGRRLAEVQREMQDIISGMQPQPDFTVIKGGKDT